MSGTVKTTQQAVDAITKMKAIIDGGLVEQITSLHREGTTLSQPENWDGSLAARFRGDWEQMHGTLEKVRTQLAELQTQIDGINKNIREAGGGFG